MSRHEALFAFGLAVAQLRKSAQRLAVLASCMRSTTRADSLSVTEKYSTGWVALTAPSVGKSLPGSIAVAMEQMGVDMLSRCVADGVGRLSAVMDHCLVSSIRDEL